MSKKLSPGDAKQGLDSAVIDIAVRLVVLGLLLYWSLTLIGPFITIVIWGVILAVALYPIFVWLRRRLGGRSSPAAIVITILFLLIIIGPVSLLGAALLENVQAYSSEILAGKISVPPPGDGVKDWPLIGEPIYQFWLLASENLESALTHIRPQLTSVASSMVSMVAGTSLGILQFIVSVIIAGCLLAPGEKLAAGTKSLAARISATRGAPFVDLGAATIRNVARGVIGISLIQSLLLGLGWLVAGVPGAGILAVVALFLGIVQIGPAILVLATLVWVWMGLDTVTALIFTVYMVPVTFMDNILKPIVMSRGLSTPMLVIFIGVIGGTLSYGIIGLFIGPIVLAVTYELIVFWVKGRTGDEPTQATENAALDQALAGNSPEQQGGS